MASFVGAQKTLVPGDRVWACGAPVVDEGEAEIVDAGVVDDGCGNEGHGDALPVHVQLLVQEVSRARCHALLELADEGRQHHNVLHAHTTCPRTGHKREARQEIT